MIPNQTSGGPARCILSGSDLLQNCFNSTLRGPGLQHLPLYMWNIPIHTVSVLVTIRTGLLPFQYVCSLVGRGMEGYDIDAHDQNKYDITNSQAYQVA